MPDRLLDTLRSDDELLGAGAAKRRIVLPYKPGVKQRLWHSMIATCGVRIYGGSMNCGKTLGACGEGIRLSIRYPGNRIAYVRKTRTAIKKTTWTTFLRWLPRELVRSVNGQDLIITLKNGSEIMFLGADISKDPLLEDLKSFEASMIYLEEATQLAEEVFFAAIQRKDRWVCPDGTRPPGGVGITTNPEIGWVMNRFYTPWSRGELEAGVGFIQALPSDNPDPSARNMEDMLRFLPETQRVRYIEGRWEAPEDPNALIAYSWLKDGMDGDPVAPGGLEVIACDVAYEGDDDSEIWSVRWAPGQKKPQPWEARRVRGLHGADEVAVGEAVERAWLDTGTRGRVIIDATGIGSGVATFLARKGIKVIRFKGGGGQLSDPDRIVFRNLRDQSYWHLRQELAAGRGTLPEDTRLIEELAALRYRIDPAGRKVEVERKVELKKRLRRSPDRADALAMGVFAPRLQDAGAVGVTVIR